MKKGPFLVIACWQFLGGPLLHAAISVGAGPVTFSTTPAITEFATAVLLGNAETFSDVATINAAVNALDAASIPGLKELPTTGTTPPATFSGGFRRNTTLNALQSRPATSGTNAANLLLATLQNNSGTDLPSFFVSYDFAVQNPIPGGELPGFHVYYSVNGSPGSWQPIEALTGSETPGNVGAMLSLGSWLRSGYPDPPRRRAFAQN